MDGTADASVRTKDTATDSARLEPVHQSVGGALFDSNIPDLVVAAMPLGPQFSADLPFFFHERGGRVPTQVKVRERARVEFPHLGAREVWIVAVGVPGAPATIWIDTATREVLRVRYDIAAAELSFADDRVTPLRS